MRHPDDHLDEGTIHAWLDGALSADEATAVEAHVAGCARCADAVAEARGLIAAASGILAKLDTVPAGVVPRPAATPPRITDSRTPVVSLDGARRERRIGGWWRSPALRVAAAMLVVASGTFVVVREREASERADSMFSLPVNRSRDAATATTTAAVAAPTAPAPAPVPASAPGAPRAITLPEAEGAPASRAERRARVAPPPVRDAVAANAAAPPAPAPAAELTQALAAEASARAPARAPAPAARVAPSQGLPVQASPMVGDASNVLPGDGASRHPRKVLAGGAVGAAKQAARDEAASPPAAQAADSAAAPALRRSDAPAAAASVTGTVRDAANGQPLAGTSVRVVGTMRGAVTDSAGRFMIAGVPVGSQLVEARRIGYQSEAARVETRPDSTARADLALSTRTQTLSTQIVTGATAGATSVVARAAGCYGVAFGEWRPARPTPPLPGRIVLRTTRSPAPSVAPGDSAFVVGPGDGASSPWRHAYWSPVGTDSIRVVWSDGAAGVEARVRLGGLTSRGTVATFSDDERRPVQHTTVTLRRARCGAP